MSELEASDAVVDGRDTSYRLQLEGFSGPLDLLLYLVQRDEIAIEQVSIADLTDQYLAFLDKLREDDLESAGDYLVMASQLLALKARALLPDDVEVPELSQAPSQQQVVSDLLAYRRLKEHAQLLIRLEAHAAQRFSRASEQLKTIALANLDIWDLVGHYQRLQHELGLQTSEHVLEFDATPLAEVVAALRGKLQTASEPLPFSALFSGGRHKLVATFLAVLELVRLGEVRTVQAEPFADLCVQWAGPQ